MPANVVSMSLMALAVLGTAPAPGTAGQARAEPPIAASQLRPAWRGPWPKQLAKRPDPFKHVDDPCDGQQRYGPGVDRIPAGALGFSCNSGLMDGDYVAGIDGQTRRPITLTQGAVITIRGRFSTSEGGNIGLFPNGAHSGLGARVLSWSGGEIRARIQVDPSYPQRFSGYMTIESNGEMGTPGGAMMMIKVFDLTVVAPRQQWPIRPHGTF